ncbi:MAG: hypothetical protein KDC35_20100 [Acidobacteria bacterium]|nr:hypothetical protein [Acidobacteriota bacterium]
MDPLMIPKSCLIQGEKITIRYEGDIQIESDLVPLSVKSDQGDIRFKPTGRNVSCSHLSAEQGTLEVDAESLETDTLSARVAILRINELVIHQSVQTSQELILESEHLKAQDIRCSELDLTAGRELDVQTIQVEGAAVLTFDRGKVSEIKGDQVTIKAGSMFECERIVASREVIFTSGKIAVKFVDAPRITADASVSGIVILTSADEVKAEGVRGFIRPQEFKMLTEQGPLLSLADGSRSKVAFEVVASEPDEPETRVDEEQPNAPVIEEVESLLEEDIPADAGEMDQAPVDDGVAEEIEDLPEQEEVGEDGEEPIELESDEEDLSESSSDEAEAEAEADAEAEDEVADDVQATPPPIPSSAIFDWDKGPEENGVEIVEQHDSDSGDDSDDSWIDEDEEVSTVSMEDEAPANDEVDEFMTREIRDFNPDSYQGEVHEPEEAEPDDDDILDVVIRSEEVEYLPEITDFEDLPELQDEDVSLNVDANSGPIDDVPVVEPIPAEDADEESPVAEISEDVDQSMHLEDETYKPTDFSLDDLELDSDSKSEDDLVRDLNEVLREIKACFPDENFPKFINQIQTYLDEKRLSILRKSRNMEAVLSSFDRLNHAGISDLAREFYRVLGDFFADESE